MQRAIFPKLDTSAGYSLIEVMVGLAVGAIVIAMIASAITTMSQLSLNQADRVDSAQMLQQATFEITSALSRGVDLRKATGNINGFSSGTSRGQLREFTRESITAGAAGDVYAIALFNREDQPSTTASGASTFRATGLYYQMPTQDSSGALYLDFGSSNRLRPRADNLLVDRVVKFAVTNVLTGSNNEVLSAQITLTLRFFMGFSVTEKGAWCPAVDMQAAVAGCGTSVPYRDIETNFQVALLNNAVNTIGLSENNMGSQGRLYYFRMISPKGFQ